MQMVLTCMESVSKENVSTVSWTCGNFMYVECALDAFVITISKWQSECFDIIFGHVEEEHVKHRFQMHLVQPGFLHKTDRVWKHCE